MTEVLLSIVMPAHNEAEGIRTAIDQVLGVLDTLGDTPSEILVVDDGSEDSTVAEVTACWERDARVGLVCLNRRFGKEAAIQAGLVHAQGRAVVVMDSDLQHPPALIPAMVRLWHQGIPVVEAVKRSRGPESWPRRRFVGGFFRLFTALSGINISQHTDFKLLDRQVVDAYLALPERQRFFRGLISWMGYSSAQLLFDVPARRHGSSAFSRLRLLGLSANLLTAFSSLPLQLMSLLGGITLLLAVVIGGIALYHKVMGLAVSGFTTVILLQLILGSFTMLGLGLIGLYLAQIFQEVKQRPAWWLDQDRSRLPSTVSLASKEDHSRR